MIALSKYLYIVDDLKWSFIDAILNKRIKESIFWITEYYESGYHNDTWKLLWIVYDCFYYTNNIHYGKIINNNYKKWKKDKNFIHILDIVYKFCKMIKFDFKIFNIVIGNLKYKKIKCEIDNSIYTKVDIKKNNLFKQLLFALKDKNYKNCWFFINLNFKVSLFIIEKYYDTIITINNDEIHDKKMQLLKFVYLQNNLIKQKSKHFKIKVKKEFISYYEELLNDEDKILKNKRHFSVPKAIGCFNLERYNFDIDFIKNNYFYKWESCANISPIWKKRFESWGVDFNSDNNPVFLNDELLEKFYSKFGLEPDEQDNETHNKSIGLIVKYDIKNWIKGITN